MAPPAAAAAAADDDVDFSCDNNVLIISSLSADDTVPSRLFSVEPPTCHHRHLLIQQILQVLTPIVQ